jgi:hypothetical protein
MATITGISPRDHEPVNFVIKIRDRNSCFSDNVKEDPKTIVKDLARGTIALSFHFRFICKIRTYYKLPANYPHFQCKHHL